MLQELVRRFTVKDVVFRMGVDKELFTEIAKTIETNNLRVKLTKYDIKFDRNGVMRVWFKSFKDELEIAEIIKNLIKNLDQEIDVEVSAGVIWIHN